MMKKISVISGGQADLDWKLLILLVKSGKNVLILSRNGEKLDRASARLKKSAEDNSVECTYLQYWQ